MNLHQFSPSFLVKSGFNGALTNATQNGVAVDTRGYRGAALIFDAVTGAATTAQVKVQESADGSTNWTDITGAVVPTVAQVASLPASGDSGVPYVIDIAVTNPRKRYLRACVIGTGAAGQAVAEFVLYNAFNMGVSQDNTAVAV